MRCFGIFDGYFRQHPEVKGDGEYSIHALSDGTVALVDGSISIFRSGTDARTWQNVSGYSKANPAAGLVSPFHFDSAVEGSAWTLLELQHAEHGMPAGIYHFTAETIWRSTDSAATWRYYAEAHSIGSTAPISAYPYGADSDAGFFMQSEVYRRVDGTFLHGARVPTHSNQCDNWDGSQLFHSVDTNGTHWACKSQAGAGYCNNASWRALEGDSVPCNWDAKGLTPVKGAARYVDQCANLTDAPFLKPGSMYTHFLRLADGRLLLTWTKRSPKFDDDGFGSGTRGLLSYDGKSVAALVSTFLNSFLRIWLLQTD